MKQKCFESFQARVSRVILVGIPTLYWAGTENGFNIMVTDLLGPCLEDLYAYCGERFGLKTST